MLGNDETKGLPRGLATDTREKELDLAPETDFILSTCTEVELKIDDFKNIAASRIGNIAAGKNSLHSRGRDSKYSPLVT